MLVKTSQFVLISLVGMPESCDALVELKWKISVVISDFEMFLKVKLLFVLVVLMAKVLGWFLYCSVILRKGSSKKLMLARNWEVIRMGITQIYACVLFYFLLKAVPL